ncbi:Thymidylate kinase [hydrothermal vent metagenome]|uniref:Thymidylate kinase n=1 Tax=hydrothermal vent metagenome TaxID=652676 RepID=A0A3B0W2N0_9ZZZZ
MKQKTIIYLSGIDGCGKTTQATHLVETLKKQGLSVEYQWLRWEPSIVNALKLIKKLLGKNAKQTSKAAATNEKADSKWDNIKKQLMKSRLFRYFWLKYASNDYYRAYKKVYKSWQADIIIMDRYIFDFTVDQSINFNLNLDEMKQVFSNSKISKMHKPEHNIIINIPAEVGYKRKMDGTSVGYLQQREKLYNSMHGENVKHIDGTTSIEEIQTAINNWIQPRIQTTTKAAQV